MTDRDATGCDGVEEFVQGPPAPTPDHGGTPGWRERLAAVADLVYDGTQYDRVNDSTLLSAGYPMRDGTNGPSYRRWMFAADLRAVLAAAAPPQEVGGWLIEERWLVEYEDGSVMDGWTEETARAAVDAREPRYSGDTTFACRAVREWRYAPSAWTEGVPPARVRVDREALEAKIATTLRDHPPYADGSGGKWTWNNGGLSLAEISDLLAAALAPLLGNPDAGGAA